MGYLWKITRNMPVALALTLCSGCCVFNCTLLTDLTFTSLSLPRDGEIRTATSKRGLLERLSFEAGTLKLRFSTQQDLLALEERDATWGTSVYLTLCDDEKGFISIGEVFTDEGWGIQNFSKYALSVSKSHAMQYSNNQITYEAKVRIDRVSRSVKDEKYGGEKGVYTDLPKDPKFLPPLCFKLRSGGGYLSGFVSNQVVLPPSALVSALEKLHAK
jgi:hypothetical protein